VRDVALETQHLVAGKNDRADVLLFQLVQRPANRVRRHALPVADAPDTHPSGGLDLLHRVRVHPDADAAHERVGLD
jgi:hypothetical protein